MGGIQEQIERLNGIKSEFQKGLSRYLPELTFYKFQQYKEKCKGDVDECIKMYLSELGDEIGIDQLQDKLSENLIGSEKEPEMKPGFFRELFGNDEYDDEANFKEKWQEVYKLATLSDIQIFQSVAPGTIRLDEKTITSNGEYDASKDDNADGYSKVTVKVPTSSTPNLKKVNGTGLITITSNNGSGQNFEYGAGYDGFDNFTVKVNVPTPTIKTVTVHHICSFDNDGFSLDNWWKASAYMDPSKSNIPTKIISEYTKSWVSGGNTQISLNNIHPTGNANTWACLNSSLNSVLSASSGDHAGTYFNSNTMKPIVYCNIDGAGTADFWTQLYNSEQNTSIGDDNYWSSASESTVDVNPGDVWILWSWR